MSLPVATSQSLAVLSLDEVTIRVYNSEGKLLHFDKNKILLEPYRIDLANYASGLYFIKVNSINGEVTKKLLVD